MENEIFRGEDDETAEAVLRDFAKLFDDHHLPFRANKTIAQSGRVIIVYATETERRPETDGRFQMLKSAYYAGWGRGRGGF